MADYNYHLSYDKKNKDDDSLKILEEISKFLRSDSKIEATKLSRHAESTIVFESAKVSKGVLTSFDNEFNSKLFFVISKIQILEDNARLLKIQPNTDLDKAYQEKLKSWSL